jgi:excisionase family DNA binding protein
MKGQKELPVTIRSSRFHLMDTQSVADHLKCSTSMVRKLNRIGALRNVRVGRLLRFRPEDITSYVEANASTTEAQ